MKKNLNKLKTKDYCLLFLTSYVLLCGLVLVFTYSRGILHYDVWDYIEGVLWTKASLDSKSIINPDFAYLGYIVPFSSTILMAPFVALLGPSLLANQLGMLIYYVIYIILVFKLSKSLFSERNSQLMFIIVSSLYIFTYAGDNTLHHILNYGVGYSALIGQISCIINIFEEKRIKFEYVLFSFLCLWAASNGIPSLAISNAPIVCGIVFYCFKNKEISKQSKIILLIEFICTVAGYLVFRYLDIIAFQHDHGYNVTMVFGSVDSFFWNITHNVFVDLFRIFYISPEGKSFFSISGIFSILKMFFLLAVLIIPFNKKQYKKLDDLKSIILIISNLAVITVCTGEYIFSAASIFRYLLNAVLSLFVIDAYFISSKNLKWKTVLIVAFFIICLSTKCFFSIKASNTYSQYVNDIVNVVKEKDIKTGYTYKDNYYGKQVDVFTAGEYSSFIINYDYDNGKFYVTKDRNYSWQREKPDEQTFYVIVALSNISSGEYKEPIDLLYKYCVDDIDVNDVKIFFFNNNDWNKIFEVKQYIVQQ